MKNKTLIVIIIFLIPIVVVSFTKSKTNFLFNEKEIIINKNNEIIKINLDDYIIGVVAAEMPASFEEEALKAQAIAARSFLLYSYEKNPDKVFDATISFQSFITKEEMKKKWSTDFPKYYDKIKIVVEETKNQVLKYNNEIVKAYYFSRSNGLTENVKNVFGEEKEYLLSVISEEKAYEYSCSYSIKEFIEKLNLNCNNVKISKITKTNSNRIDSIEICSQTYKGTEIRKKLNLKSTDFYIEINNNNIEITTKGYGHGVGMSQYGANELAKKGYKAEEILKHYYQNTYLEKI